MSHVFVWYLLHESLDKQKLAGLLSRLVLSKLKCKVFIKSKELAKHAKTDSTPLFSIENENVPALICLTPCKACKYPGLA